MSNMDTGLEVPLEDIGKNVILQKTRWMHFMAQDLGNMV